MITRRKFLGTAIAGGAGLAFASTAGSYARIFGANDRVNFAVVGLHGRGGDDFDRIDVQGVGAAMPAGLGIELHAAEGNEAVVSVMWREIWPARGPHCMRYAQVGWRRTIELASHVGADQIQ